MPEAVADRTLPHNLEAERSVLGAILLHNDAFNLAAEVIDAHDFFRDAHRRIFDKMVNLAERGDAIDLVTLKEELGRSGDLEEVGGPAYIAALVDGVPRSTNVEHYARIIKEKATLRNLIASANKILVDGVRRRGGGRRHPRPGRARHLRHRRRQGARRLRVAARPGADQLRDDREAARPEGARHRRADRLHRSRRDDLGPPAVGPRHRRGAARRWGRRRSR